MTPLKTLLDERFAPITSAIGFLELPLDDVANAYEDWMRSLHDEVSVERLTDEFPDALHRLEPLTGGARPRAVLVSAGQWTAYFDNSLRGTDAVSPIGHLSEELRCPGVIVKAVPHTIGVRGIRQGRAGAVQFQLLGPLQTTFLNHVRTVAVTFDGSRWRFDLSGVEQGFEEVDAYRARRVRDRFTSDMLERYCHSLGVEVFTADAYGPEAVFIESRVTMPPDGAVMTLAQAQAWLEIKPELAPNLPG